MHLLSFLDSPLCKRKMLRQQHRVTLSIVTGLLVMTVSGGVYLFSTYSNSLRDVLGYSQAEISIISSVGQSVYYVAGAVWGPVVDRYPPNFTVIFSTICATSGYFLMGMTQARIIDQSNYLLFTTYYVLVGLGCSGLYMCALSVNVKVVSVKYRGLVVGAHAGLLGLSAAILNFAAIIFTNDDGVLIAEHLLYFLGGVVAFAGLSASVGLFNRFKTNKKHGTEEDEKKNIIEEDPSDEEEEEVEETVPYEYQTYDETFSVQSKDSMPNYASSSKFHDTTDLFADDKDDSKKKKSTFGEMCTSVDYWLFMFILTTVAASQLMYFTHVSSMARVLGIAEGYDDAEIQRVSNRQVSILSLSNCLGRFGIGLLADYSFSRFGMRRRIWFTIATFLVFISQMVCLLLNQVTFLTIATVMVGLSYGSAMSSGPTTVGEIFLLSHFGLYWGVSGIGPSLLNPFTNLLFGIIFDNKTGFDDDNTSDPLCDGSECYRSAFVITGALTFLTFLVALYFASRKAHVNGKWA
eukprot:Lithocolla_globosa_v1_NODE_607_length_3612_cov_5.506888.p1 type:complete len:520 gc:universal NODE_607_length_3612_cov_5.506888:1832-3391(+)